MVKKRQSKLIKRVIPYFFIYIVVSSRFIKVYFMLPCLGCLSMRGFLIKHTKEDEYGGAGQAANGSPMFRAGQKGYRAFMGNLDSESYEGVTAFD